MTRDWADIVAPMAMDLAFERPAPRCFKCAHPWGVHDGRDERAPDIPCCMHYAGMGEPCGCSQLPPLQTPPTHRPTGDTPPEYDMGDQPAYLDPTKAAEYAEMFFQARQGLAWERLTPATQAVLIHDMETFIEALQVRAGVR